MRLTLNQPLGSLEGPGLRRCVTLALLLHLLVIILFGSAPAGMALRGDGVWGRLSVSLTGAEMPGKVPTASLEAYKRSQGEAQRPGGSQREAGSPRAMAPPQAATAATPLEALNPESSERTSDAARQIERRRRPGLAWRDHRHAGSSLARAVDAGPAHCGFAPPVQRVDRPAQARARGQVVGHRRGGRTGGSADHV